jgi:hypothetical protein
VHADGQSARARRQVVTAERPLPPFVELAVCIEGVWVGGDDGALLQKIVESLVEHSVSFAARE